MTRAPLWKAALREAQLARLVYRLRNDGSQDVDVVGINDGDDLTASEALVILLKTLASNVDAVAEQIDQLR